MAIGTINPLPKLLHLVLIGPSGSGKGTIAKQIKRQHKNVIHISAGDMLRQQLDLRTSAGKKAEPFLATGRLAPDEMVVGRVFNEITKAAGYHWILDGFPCTLEQARILHNINGKCDDGTRPACDLPRTSVTAVLNITAPEGLLLERLRNRYVHLPSGRTYNKGFDEPKIQWKDDITGDDLVQRADDRPGIVIDRIKLHTEQTQPVLDFYRHHGIKVLDLDARDPAKVWRAVSSLIMCELGSSKT